MKHLPLIALIAIASAPVNGQASEQTTPRGPKQMFETLDVNNNGVVTHAEFMSHNNKRFSEFDKDGDGYLTLAELPERMPLPARAQRRLELKQERMKNRMERRGLSPDDDIKEIEPVKARRMNFMARLDKDGDERLTAEEFAAPPLKRFKRVDGNGDGAVTEAEVEQAMFERGRKHRDRRHW